MTLEQVVERVGKGVSRRRFLAKAGSVFLGATAAILGMPLAAQGLVCSYCCCVCYSPGGACCSGQCVWSWTCCYVDGRKFRCSEYYCTGGACNGNCTNVTCSTVTHIGSCGQMQHCYLC